MTNKLPELGKRYRNKNIGEEGVLTTLFLLGKYPYAHFLFDNEEEANNILLSSFWVNFEELPDQVVETPLSANKENYNYNSVVKENLNTETPKNWFPDDENYNRPSIREVNLEMAQEELKLELEDLQTCDKIFNNKGDQ